MTRKKTIESSIQDINNHTLKKTLNWWSLIGIGLGNVIGAGIFILTGVIARDKSGPAVVLSFVFSGIACIFSALCYAELSNKVPGAGSSYSFCYVTMGEFIGWIMGWNISIGMIVTVSAVTRGLVSYTVGVLKSYSIQLPIWLYEIGPFKGNFLAVVVIIIFCTLLCFGLKSFAFMNNIMLAATVFVILFVIFCGFFYADPQNWSPFFPYGIQGIFAGASITFYSYSGFECVVTCAEEVHNQKRDIPIGLFGTLGIAMILYIGVSSSITLMVKYTDIDVNSPLSTAFVSRGLRWMSTLIGIGAFFALMTSILTNILGASRLFFSMSRDSLLPPFMATINRRFESPIISTIVIGVIASLLAFFLPLEELADIVSIGTLFAFALVCFCVLILRYKKEDNENNSRLYIHLFSIFSLVLISSFLWNNKVHIAFSIIFSVLALVVCVLMFFLTQLNIPETFKCPLVPLFPLLGIVLNLFMISTFNFKIWIYFFLSLIPAFLIYFFYGMRASALNVEGIEFSELTESITTSENDSDNYNLMKD